jgi:hypothetical protein
MGELGLLILLPEVMHSLQLGAIDYPILNNFFPSSKTVKKVRRSSLRRKLTSICNLYLVAAQRV